MSDAIITKTELPASVQAKDTADLMVRGANGQAKRVAPCLFAEGEDAPAAEKLDEAKLVLLGAIIRWTQQGASGAQQQSAGPFAMTTFQNQSTGYRLWPSEITQLQEICAGGATATVGAIDTAPRLRSGHLPWCDINFGAVGAQSCSCGYDLAGRPIYENKPGL